MPMDSKAVASFVNKVWDESIIPALVDYIAIPAKSPLFDPDWEANGHIEAAVQLIARWCEDRDIAGLQMEIIRLPGCTPLIYMEIPGDSDDTVLMYGHLDKQPEMRGWRKGLSPWKPVIEGDKLYGRGGADDGYAAFASLTAVEALQKHGGHHQRVVVLIEACEESGSPDLPHYIDHLSGRIGQVSLVICLDSGAGDYDRLWSTTSLRGMVSGDLRVDVLTQGIHSGDGSGIVPSSFRVIRQLLERIEAADTGEVLLPEFHVEIPQQRRDQAVVVADILGNEVRDCYPFVEGVSAMHEELPELVLNRTWRPTISYTGSGGLPELGDAGNVLRPFSALKLSFRLPPTADSERASDAVQKVLEESPPSGATVRFIAEKGADGWNAPPLADWLGRSLEEASQKYFGNPPAYMGEGGTIPFMGMLGEKFPEAQFVITGVLGPASNAHGPNEFLHIPCGKKLTSCVVHVLQSHAER